MRGPLGFDQLVDTKYVRQLGHRYAKNQRNKSCVTNSGNGIYSWGTAFSNNILRAGKHYVEFTSHGYNNSSNFFVGVMRPGKANENARRTPVEKSFFQHFSRLGHGEDNNNSVHCCLYGASLGYCVSSDWGDSYTPDVDQTWEGSESMFSDGEIGLLLDLDEGSLTVYKNGQKLGVMKRGLTGPYCWVASMSNGVQMTIKRGTIVVDVKGKMWRWMV